MKKMVALFASALSFLFFLPVSARAQGTPTQTVEISAVASGQENLTAADLELEVVGTTDGGPSEFWGGTAVAAVRVKLTKEYFLVRVPGSLIFGPIFVSFRVLPGSPSEMITNFTCTVRLVKSAPRNTTVPFAELTLPEGRFWGVNPTPPEGEMAMTPGVGVLGTSFRLISGGGARSVRVHGDHGDGIPMPLIVVARYLVGYQNFTYRIAPLPEVTVTYPRYEYAWVVTEGMYADIPLRGQIPTTIWIVGGYGGYLQPPSR